MDNVESAISQTQAEGTNATIVSGAAEAAFQNKTAFSPNPIEIDRGDTVTWINKDFDSHTVTSGSAGNGDEGDDFDSGYMGPQNTFSHEFEHRGEFDYFCESQHGRDRNGRLARPSLFSEKHVLDTLHYTGCQCVPPPHHWLRHCHRNGIMMS
jgi:plastocyanin